MTPQTPLLTGCNLVGSIHNILFYFLKSGYVAAASIRQNAKKKIQNIGIPLGIGFYHQSA